MLPASIVLRNYRCFASQQELELRPVTLLYGNNNAGKSALLRSLPLLSDSIGTDGLDALEVADRLAPLELDFEALRRKGRTVDDDHDIGLGLRWPDGAPVTSVDWSIIEEPDWHRLIVSSFRVQMPNGTTSTLQWIPRREDERSAALSYQTEKEPELLEFRGLVPGKLQSKSTPDAIQAATNSIAPLKGAVLWLRSLRPAPLRTTRWTGAVRRMLAPDGRDAPILLASDPEILEEVSTWYEVHFGARLVLDEPRKREVRTLLRQRFDVDLADTGEGVSQCLPVLTALAMSKHGEEHNPRIVAVEEPEAHLHPKLQRAIAERICETAASSPHSRIVLETHSENILLTVQLSVLKGLLRPKDVVIYWVRSIAHGQSLASKVELDLDGRFVGNWPPSAFDEDRALVAEILDARDQRGATS